MLLNTNQITGTIPTFITSLVKLQYIYLSGNQMEGEIPQNWGNMTMLYYLLLDGNKFSGAIPALAGQSAGTCLHVCSEL
ncbi:MAG: hypothetical protein IPK96_11330 [Flammeovirgaceae bacterium]|nr:hypothetical protein [Flammeovirgaceae bacterium]